MVNGLKIIQGDVDLHSKAANTVAALAEGQPLPAQVIRSLR